MPLKDGNINERNAMSKRKYKHNQDGTQEPGLIYPSRDGYDEYSRMLDACIESAGPDNYGRKDTKKKIRPKGSYY